MKERFEKCSVLITQRVDSRQEKGKTFCLRNETNRRINFVEVDGCLLSGEEKKCDFLYEIFDCRDGKIERVYYVELKGTDFSHGIEQLESTIKILREWHGSIQHKYAFLVGRQIPSFQTKIQKITLRFRNSYGVIFKAKTNQMEVKV